MNKTKELDIAENVVIPNKLQVFTDKKSGAQSVAFPFTFPDGKHGFISITRLSRFPWKPSDDIESVQIVWNRNKQFQE